MKKESSQKSSEIIKKQKERHIVTWSQQEDDILREQISIHGTENWTIIASKFKDKTTRQCRRRWYTYLNSDFKKGGWSPEEDMLLCEAQKIFGNRWTEIAKVVSGRTDNAVKNRFTTLCKKRAKHQDTILKENKSFRINQNNKRVIFQNGFVEDGASESAAPLKKMRTHISDVTEVCNPKGRLFEGNKQLRPPFAVIVQNSRSVCELPSQQHVSNSTSTGSNDAATGKNNDQGMFLKRDDPKLTFLMQQAELLSSLAAKVNEKNNNQSLENAWKELHDFLNRAHESDLPRNNVSEEDFRLEDLKNLIEDWKISTPGSHLYWRESDFHKESPRSPGYSTESTLQSDTIGEITEQPAPEVCSLQQSKDVEPQSVHILVENYGAYSWDEFSGASDANIRAQLIHTEEKSKDNADHSEGFDTVKNVSQVVLLPSMDEPADKDTFTSSLPNMEFSSPLQVTPLFRTLAAGIPSPKFSESERNFLLKTLGQESLSPNPSQPPPPCKRALLHSL